MTIRRRPHASNPRRSLPARRRNGELWTHLLKPNENPEIIARILTKQIRSAMYGDAYGTVSSCPIERRKK